MRRHEGPSLRSIAKEYGVDYPKLWRRYAQVYGSARNVDEGKARDLALSLLKEPHRVESRKVRKADDLERTLQELNATLRELNATLEVLSTKIRKRVTVELRGQDEQGSQELPLVGS